MATKRTFKGAFTCRWAPTDGIDGNGIASAVVLYAVTTSPSIQPTDSQWVESLSGYIVSTYIWQCTKTTYTNGTVEYQGKRCLGSSIDFVDTETQYSRSESGTTAPTSGWIKVTTPLVKAGYYLWERTAYKWVNGDTYSTPVCKGYWAKDGIQGMIQRVSEWVLNAEYSNDTNLTTTPRYIDIVTVTDSSTGDFKMYQCLQSHKATADNKPGNTSYWSQLNSMRPIYTPLIVAKNAVMRLAQSNQIVIVNSNSKVQGCFGGVDDETNGYPLWVGGETATASKFRVKYDGTIEAKGGEFNGFVRKSLCTITPDNFDEYCTTSEYAGYVCVDLMKTGSMVEFSGDLKTKVGSGNEIAIYLTYGDSGSDENYESLTYLDQKIVIINNCNVSVGVAAVATGTVSPAGANPMGIGQLMVLEPTFSIVTGTTPKYKMRWNVKIAAQ